MKRVPIFLHYLYCPTWATGCLGSIAWIIKNIMPSIFVGAQGCMPSLDSMKMAKALSWRARFDIVADQLTD